MNENLDLTKILEGCPMGTVFYSTIYGEVGFIKININDVYPVELDVYNKYTGSRVSIYYTKDGKLSTVYDGECTLFPSKDQRDWSKFERFWDKPKAKKFDPKTLQPFDKVLVRDSEMSPWYCDFYSHINKEENMYNIGCIGNAWDMCIPYNDETKHLVSTKDDCAEYYKWWEE